MGDEQERAFVALADDDAWKRHPGARWQRWLTEAVCAGMGQSMAHEHSGQRAAMAGIEARHPLLDVDVVELMFRVPPELAFQGALSRPLLRAAVAGLVPDVVRLRPDKRSFDAIFQQAIAGPDLPIARRLLGDDAELGAYIDLVAMRTAVLDRVPADGPDRQHWTIQMWRLVTAECWLRAQSDAGAPRRIAELVGINIPNVHLELARVQP
jgi:asparagine synthetase B (glutamine-hydrolysing)